MKKYLLISSSVLLLLSACNKDMEESISGNKPEKSTEIILQERDASLPTEWSKKKIKTKVSPRSSWPVDQYIGRSYVIGNAIIGDNENAKLAVVNYDKIKNEVLHDNIGKTNISISTFAGYDRYEEKSEFVNKISSGFTLNLGLFKIGQKKVFSEKFNENSIDEKLRVNGNVNIEVRDASYKISVTSSSMKKIAANSLAGSFLDDLYNSPIVEILDVYGPFVITGYYSGGRATALYLGEETTTKDEVSRESDLNSDINVSFSWGNEKKDPNNNVKFDYGFGNKDGSGTDTETKLKNTYITVETTGGANNLQVNTSVSDIKSMGVDMSAWLSSLNDKSTHKLIGIYDAGLTAISSFMLEENFKQRVQDTHLGYLYIDALIEPFIEIVKVLVRSTAAGEPLYEIAAVLNTRQGDKIILSDGKSEQATDAELRANNDNATFTTKSQAIANNKKNFYKCAIKADANKKVNPIIRTPLSIKLNNISEGRMYKFKNSSTNMWYIYDPVGLCAYSFYLDDYILEIYGMKSWIDTVPVQEISMTNLYQRYTIIGL